MRNRSQRNQRKTIWIWFLISKARTSLANKIKCWEETYKANDFRWKMYNDRSLLLCRRQLSYHRDFSSRLQFIFSTCLQYPHSTESRQSFQSTTDLRSVQQRTEWVSERKRELSEALEIFSFRCEWTYMMWRHRLKDAEMRMRAYRDVHIEANFETTLRRN